MYVDSHLGMVLGGQIGAGEAGKTTIIKQMKLMHASGFSEAEREVFRTYVFSNMVASMKSILMQMQERHVELTNRDNEVTFHSHYKGRIKKEIGSCLRVV